ncbi:hypothetical protein [Adhaeribacter radiodurans]|uniref:Uncharacterized protein n=1 Tax=Adhaeribacter radiodurans TaxID=2745197 RepID=A0A7L7LDG4_9BACT|nr:hypothetical protein [Adhaeribacter radiodurans]QMU30575.1 hypothetical protein HUW48_22240 [Adhaeribacter radiodurans]
MEASLHIQLYLKLFKPIVQTLFSELPIIKKGPVKKGPVVDEYYTTSSMI